MKRGITAAEFDRRAETGEDLCDVVDWNPISREEFLRQLAAS